MPKELQTTPVAPVKPPNGMYTGKLDEKGRMKLPACFLEYFAGLNEKEMFVTSLDRTTAQIYTNSGWTAKKASLMTSKEHAKAAQNVVFTAAEFGQEAEIDGSGRLMFNSVLRRGLGLDDQTLRLYVDRDRVEVLPEAVYQARTARAVATAAEDNAELQEAGLL